MHALHHRKASVTAPPTCSSSAGRIFGTRGVPQRLQRKRVLAMARPCRAVFTSRSSRRVAKPCREAARAIDVQLQAVEGNVAYRLERKFPEHAPELVRAPPRIIGLH